MKSLVLAFLFLVLLPVNIPLEKRSLVENRIEMLIPVGFTQMRQEMLDAKYPNKANKPTFVLTNPAGTVNIALNWLSNPANARVVEGYKNSIKKSYTKSFPEAVWQGDGVNTINGKKVGYLKLITQAQDQKIYNYLFLTDLGGRLLLGTFNCTEDLLPAWEATAEQMVLSLKVKP